MIRSLETGLLERAANATCHALAESKFRTGISRCLSGNAVRHDGGGSVSLCRLTSSVVWRNGSPLSKSRPLYQKVQAGFDTPREAMHRAGSLRSTALRRSRRGPAEAVCTGLPD
ncbi:MAG: hypothetical protein D6690_04690 [Nitrospirae bacterium]|nr:MAG: hypothetical protein D6690_04690 [Nitrospirota bacterium]